MAYTQRDKCPSWQWAMSVAASDTAGERSRNLRALTADKPIQGASGNLVFFVVVCLEVPLLPILTSSERMNPVVHCCMPDEL